MEHASNRRLVGNILLHLSLLANHILNITCSLGDLGCISFILWGFEDRELVFISLDLIFGARIQDSTVTSIIKTPLLDTLHIAILKLDTLLDIT